MRAVTVFFSSTADVMPARDELAKVVDEIAAHFRPLDIHVSSWSYDHRAVPGVGGDAQQVVDRQLPDYDVYVGLLCGRLGTPTARALSGTVEEFLAAKKRFEENDGRPAILFYFCRSATPPEDTAQRMQWEQVRDFRRSYPGLFASYDSVEELREMFKGHLLDVLLRDLHRPASPPRAWLPPLAATLDAVEGGSVGYLDDRSSAAMRRMVEKFRGLIDLEATLRPREVDALLAAITLRALTLRRADDSPARAVLREAKGVDPRLEEMAVTVAEFASVEPEDLTSGELEIGGVRCHFLATLLQLGELLDLDHAAIAGARPPQPPEPEAELPCWLAYYTARIEVKRPGIVIFHLRHAATDSVPAAKALARCAALTFELAWQRRRRILTSNGVTVSRAPSVVLRSPHAMPLTEDLTFRLAAATRDAVAHLPALLHLSEAIRQWPAVETLLPLPSSAVLGGLQLRWDKGRFCEVRVYPPIGGGPPRTLAETDAGEAFVDAAALAPAGSRCAWELVEDLGGVLTSGEAWALGPAEARRWAAVADMDDDSARQSWRMSLGLWNDLLAAAWPRLAVGTSQPSETALVYDVLLASYEWLRARAPDSGRIDQFRNATQLVRAAFLEARTSPS